MRTVRSFVMALFAVALAGSPASATNLVTGNGFGFAVVNPESATITRFYAHPYSFTQPDPSNPLSEGVETTNFIKSISFRDSAAKNASAEYENDSHIIRIRNSAGEGDVFFPFGLARPALIIAWNPSPGGERTGGMNVDWNHHVATSLVFTGVDFGIRQVLFQDCNQTLLLIPLAPPSNSATSKSPLDGSPAWALVSIEKGDDPNKVVDEFNRWRRGLSPSALIQRELADLEHWRVHPTVHFASETERHLWRQSEVMLRIAQSREPNRADRHSNGLIVASLPDGVWFTPWVRDMAWATVALARMGHRDEARAALLAWFNAQPTGKMRAEVNGADYQVSVVLYFGNGEEEPFFTMEGNTNIEFDDWGEALWAHTEKYGGGLIVDADTSIWEERQKDKKHFAFSTAMAIVALREFAEVAQMAGDEATGAK